MDKISVEQALIIMGFTGITTVKFPLFHEDVERRMGRPVFTHEFASRSFEEQLKEKYKDDFLAILPDD